jgi:RNA polymerase sigma-70 factor (ECF subfamily)
MTMPAAALIEKSKQGDGEAFSKLVHLYEDKIFNLAHKVCVNAPSEADDIYQETFLTAFKKIKSFKAASDLGTWLYRIASNLCFMRLRKKRREPFVPILDAPVDGEHHEHVGIPEKTLKTWAHDAETDHRKKELADAVNKALGLLPVDYRLVVTMKDIQGLSNEDISKALDLSVPAVKSRLHRGRLFLRDRLEKHYGEVHP